MLKNNFKYLTVLVIFVFLSCAKRGTITGGEKDTIAPVLKVSFPKNFSTDFKEKEIKLTFDEYIVLKNLNKQLIISPPLKNEPLISPTTATKYLTIKIKDTLQPNTTYSFNFGQSITDNNEGNAFNQFKYVFSTGKYIDSLSLSGTVKHAFDKEAESFVSVMLYEANDSFKDSVIYKQTPRYVTNTLDSLKTFKLENLKAGKYLLVAMKDVNSNNKYNPKTDKIAFRKQFVTVPNDSVFELKLFKENSKFKAIKPVQSGASRLLMGYEGSVTEKDKPNIVLKNNNVIMPVIITKFPKKDTLQIWFKPQKLDSLSFSVSKDKDKYKDKFSVKIKKQKKDSLDIKPLQNGNLNLRDRFAMESNTPLVKFDKSKIKLTNKDSTSVVFTTEYDEFNQKLYFDFKKEPSQKYRFSLMPGAITDFYEKANDTLIYNINTLAESDYGNLSITLQNIKKFPLLIELTNEKGEVMASEYSEKKTQVDFNLVEPSNYTVRAIYDENKNKVWDTGSYLEKQQPEEVVYLFKEVDVRANWEVTQAFDLSSPYVAPSKPKKKKEEKKSTGF
jgi:uncharacterized protein (DUF2141 family)